MSLPSTQRYRALLHTYFWPQRRQVTLLLLLIIADNVLLLVGPGLLSQFVDAAIVGAAAPVLVSISAWYLIAALSQQAMTMSATYVGEKTGWHAANALRADIAKHTLDLDMSFHKKQTPGIMIERIDGDVASLNRFFSQMVLQIGGSILLLTSSVGVLMYLEWRLGSFCWCTRWWRCGCSSVFVGLPFPTGRQAVRHQHNFSAFSKSASPASKTYADWALVRMYCGVSTS